jgi:hypothetical protein
MADRALIGMSLHGRIGLAVVAATLGMAAPAQGAASVVGQWRFGEPSGLTALDDGPFGLDGTLDALPGAAPPARVPGALQFDGTNFVRLPDSAALEPEHLAVEAVVRASTSPGAFRYVIAHGGQGCTASSYALYTGAEGGIAFYVFDGRSYRISATAAPGDVWDGRWHHIAGVYDGASVRLFVDGRAVGSPEPAPAPARIEYALGSSAAYVGTYRGGCVLPLIGDVDLVRLWNGPLAPDFLAQLADEALAGRAPATPPVVPPGGSDASAPSSRPPLEPITPGTTIHATGSAMLGPECRDRTPRVRVGARHVTTVDVRVRMDGRPARHARVRATTSGAHPHRLVTVRTSVRGHARLRLHPAHASKVRLSVVGATRCAPVRLTVLRVRRG